MEELATAQVVSVSLNIRSILWSNYPMKKNCTSCNDSINFGSGTHWMRDVIASFAVKSSLGAKSM